MTEEKQAPQATLNDVINKVNELVNYTGELHGEIDALKEKNSELETFKKQVETQNAIQNEVKKQVESVLPKEEVNPTTTTEEVVEEAKSEEKKDE